MQSDIYNWQFDHRCGHLERLAISSNSSMPSRATNPLARNATIEGALLGDAGNGLAAFIRGQSSCGADCEGTREIGQQITSIQRATDEVGRRGPADQRNDRAALNVVSRCCGRGGEGAATQEVSGNAQQPAQGTHEVATNITDVPRAAPVRLGECPSVVGCRFSVAWMINLPKP